MAYKLHQAEKQRIMDHFLLPKASHEASKPWKSLIAKLQAEITKNT